MTSSQWANDIEAAVAAGIDGFAMNIAVQDSYTDTVLALAFSVAKNYDFTLFLSFDYASGGAWAASDVITKINTYKSQSAYATYNGEPIVSTFEGTANANDWTTIKASVSCFFMPDWTSLGPTGVDYSLVDGIFSWDAWPDGPNDISTSSDKAWMSAAGSKPYMMPASPWFYTNLPAYSKNWLWRGDDMWYQRWQQIIDVQPQFVEILTWNDYGESHYIGPIYDAGIPTGASTYVDGFSHEAWRTHLPNYIKAYKAGSSSTLSSAGSDTIAYWYRINPADSGSADGTTGNDPAYQTTYSPGDVSMDKVFVTVDLSAAADVSIQIGSGNSATTTSCNSSGINHVSVPFDGQTGDVKISIIRSGSTVTSVTGGTAITTDCTDGNVNWNAFVGSSS